MVLIFVGECFCILAGVYACCDGFLYGYFPVFNLIMRLTAASAWGMGAMNYVA